MAHGAVDSETEALAELADVAGGGADLVEDAVLAQCLGGEVDLLVRPPFSGPRLQSPRRLDRPLLNIFSRR